MSSKSVACFWALFFFLRDNPLHLKCSRSKPSYGHLPPGRRPQPPECSACGRSGHAAAGDPVMGTPAPPPDQKLSEDRHLARFGHRYVPCALSSATLWPPAGLGSKCELPTLTAEAVIRLGLGPRPHLGTRSVFPTGLRLPWPFRPRSVPTRFPSRGLCTRCFSFSECS